MSTFGKNLKQYRKARDMNQEELSFLSGISKPAISQLETGIRSPNLATILTIQKALGGVSLDWLLTGKEDVKCPKCKLVKRDLLKVINKM